jgi:hypothetical protein
MMPESVFIETTIPSYLVAYRSRDIIQMARQELTNQWWTHLRHDYDLFSSQIVLDELARGDPEMAHQRLTLLKGLPLLDIDDAVIALAKELVAESIVPEKAADDAFHIACSGVHRMDYLLTWNCKHIANPHIQRRIRACFSQHGVHIPIICTPEEFAG